MRLASIPAGVLVTFIAAAAVVDVAVYAHPSKRPALEGILATAVIVARRATPLAATELDEIELSEIGQSRDPIA